MTDRERMLNIMNHEPVDRVIWQPRLELWYNTARRSGTLPERYREATLLDLYDDLGCSIRAYDFYNQAFLREDIEGVSTEVIENTPKRYVDVLHTPVGDLTQMMRKTEQSSLLGEFYIKEIADIEVIEYILKHQRWRFDQEKYAEMESVVGDRGAPTIYCLRTPLMRLFIEYMGFENTIYAMHEHPERMGQLIRYMEETDQAFFDMVKNSPLPMLNFGDNVDSNMLPPSLMQKWTLPYYQRRTSELREVGIRSYPHWDGALKGLLPFIREAGFDGYEALTPEPMGDVSIEEIAEVMGHDYAMVDGIPASMFCEPFTMKEVEEFTIRCIDLFAPWLIFGVSDELPPDADIERVRLVADIVRDYRPN
jgi:hypothetical protein